MTRKINLKKVLDGDDAQYVRDRPWLIRDAELEGIKVRFADDLDGDFEVDDEDEDTDPGEQANPEEDDEDDEDEPEAEDYSGKEWTVDSLTAEIDSRNEERDEDDQIVPDTGKKADLIKALLEDDEAMAESEEDEEDDSPEE